METQFCTQCKNTTFRFDKKKHSIVCTVCGHETNATMRVNEMMQYDQQRTKAIAFIKSRDYASAKQFLERMRNMKPDDPDIYYLHLMGLTDCCKNFLLEDNQTVAIASQYWETLSNLNGDRRIFMKYMKQRRDAALDKYNKLFARYMLITVLGVISTLLSLAFVGQGFFVFIIGIIASVFFLYKTKAIKKVYHFHKRTKEIEASNTPFFKT